LEELVVKAFICAGTIFILSIAVAGCGGGGSGSSGGGGSGSGGGTPDMGTLVMPETTNQVQFQNAATSMVLGINGQSQTAGANIAQESSSSTTDSMWHFMPIVYASDTVNIENLLTHQVLGISNASTSTGAQAVQYSDNGTADHNWQLYLLADGNYLIKNVNSSYYLQVEGSSTSATATIDQSARATSGSGCTCQEWSLVQTSTPAYPVPRTVTGTGIYVHDPNLIIDPSTGTYWLYGTHQTIASSTDLTTFTSYTSCTSAQMGGYAPDCPIIGPDFPSWSGAQTPPAWNNGLNVDIWAPDIIVANGTYYLYYALPWEPDTLGGEALIGLATSTSPTGPWTDDGFIVQSWSNSSTPPAGWGFTAGTTYNAIDPAPFIDSSGNWWLAFGSWFDGVHLVQLDPTTGKPVAGASMPVIAYRLAGEEGSFIYPWVLNGTQYYYYFASINTCCIADATYRIVVGRSTSPAGPFVDRGGIDLAQQGGTILLSTHSNIVGPGGQSVYTDTVSGTPTPTIAYHYYDGNNNGTPTLGINRLTFTSDGWPVIE
jgi:arabinan endo-1,5-alpha-L-arabinosidase